MSLVNDMLRDLEQRNKKPGGLSDGTLSVKAAQVVENPKKSSDNNIRYLLWVVGFVAIAATLWLLWQDKVKTSNARVEKLSETPSKEITAYSEKLVKPTSIPQPDVKGLDVAKGPAKIESVRWSGTEQGGDLVVRLDSEADIQLLRQDQKTITIAFEGAVLEESIPKIKSSIIKGIDIFRNGSRTELTLNAEYESQFAFRVQHDPETMILGVLPQTLMKEEEVVPIESVAIQEPITKPVTHVNPEVVTAPKRIQATIKRDSQPVKKVQRVLSDNQTVNQAQKLIGQGDVQKAVTLLEKRINTKPEDAALTRGYLSTVFISIGDQAKAQKTINEGLLFHPENSGLLKLQSRVLLSNGEAEQAALLLQKLKPAVADDPEFYELLATIHQQLGNYDQSAQVYYSLLQYQHNTPRWWVGMGYSLELAKRYEEALRAYQSALQIPGIVASLKTYAEQRSKSLAGR